jgi:hypothetical protein
VTLVLVEGTALAVAGAVFGFFNRKKTMLLAATTGEKIRRGNSL